MKTTHKQALALLLALVLLLSLCACAQKAKTEPDESKMSTRSDKEALKKQQEEAVSQNDMDDRAPRDEAVDTLPEEAILTSFWKIIEFQKPF